MTDRTSRLIVRLVDGVSGPARAAAGALRGLSAAATGSTGASLVAMQGRVAKAMERNSQAIATMQTKLMGAAVTGYALNRALAPAIGTAMDFETTLEDIGQKADMTGAALKSVGARIREIGKSVNRLPTDIAGSVDVLVGRGLGGRTEAENLENALAMAPAIGRTATAFRANATELAQAAHAVFLNFKVPAVEMQDAFDRMAMAGQEGGFELKRMAKWFPALGAAALSLGMKGTKAVADVSAALQIAVTGAADEDQAANNLANFFQKLTMKETVKNFRKFGVNVYKELEYARKKGLSPIEHMMNVLKKITKGNADLIPQIFGDKQVLEFIRPMWANMERYVEIRRKALEASGYTEQMFGRRMETARAKTDGFLGSIERLQIALGNALLPGFTALIGKLGGVAEAFERFSDAHPRIASAIAGLGAGMVALRVASLLTGISGRVAYGGLLLMASGGLRALRVLRALTVLPIAALARTMSGFFQTLAMRAGLATAAAGRAPGVFSRLGDAFLVLGRGLARMPMNLLRGVGGALVGMGPAGWAAAAGVAAVAWGAAVLAKNWDKFKSFGSGFLEGFARDLKPAGEALKPIADAASRLWNALSDLVPTLSGSNAEWKSWGETMGGVVAGAVNRVADAIGSVVDFIGSAISKARELASAIAGWAGGGASPTAGVPAGARGAPPGRSRGGHVSRGSAYVVGERRAEIFTPGTSGYITPRLPDGRSRGTAPNINVAIHVNGAGDPNAVADVVEQRLSRRLGDLLRGGMGDIGIGWGPA